MSDSTWSARFQSTEELVCATCRRLWTRQKLGGRKPRTCPSCQKLKSPSSDPAVRRQKRLAAARKTCGHCGVVFAPGQYRPRRRAIHMCADCQSVVGHCTRCDSLKPRTEFPRSTKSAIGIGSWCLACQRTHYATTDPAHRNGRKYGLTAEEVRSLAAAQNNRCALCGTPEAEAGVKGLAVDHDHSTGRVRALLCGRCNTGLGLFRDDPELLNTAMHYLLKWRQPE